MKLNAALETFFQNDTVKEIFVVLQCALATILILGAFAAVVGVIWLILICAITYPIPTICAGICVGGPIIALVIYSTNYT